MTGGFTFIKNCWAMVTGLGVCASQLATPVTGVNIE